MYSVATARPDNRPTNPRSPNFDRSGSAGRECGACTACFRVSILQLRYPPLEALSHTRSPVVSRAGPVVVQGYRSAVTMPSCQKKLACVLASSSKSYHLSIPDLGFGGWGWEDPLESRLLAAAGGRRFPRILKQGDSPDLHRSCRVLSVLR